MKKFTVAIIAVILISSLGGCATTSETGQKTAVGASFGSILGAAIGFAASGGDPGWTAAGMAIGAASGGLTGFLIGKYEEDQIMSRQQVYTEYPEYSNSGAEIAADIRDLSPQLLDQYNNPVVSLAPNQTIKMVSEYTIVASPGVTHIQVKENNYLIMPDGSKTQDTIRTVMRGVQRVQTKQSITLPDRLPPGIYTHVAVVMIGDTAYQSEQYIEVTAMQ